MSAYERRVRRVLLAVLALNLAVAAAKIVAGLRANSLAVLGDGLHSTVDASANVVALVVLRYAARPPDEDHPYGHSRYETLAAFALAGFLLVTAFELGRSAVQRLFAPQPTDAGALTLGVMLVTLAVNVGVAIFETRAGRRHQSELLLADAAQTRSDIYVSLAVLGGLVLTQMGLAWADGALALLVALSIAYAGYRVFSEVLPVLTDRIAVDPHDVARVVRSVPGVLNVHDIRSRGGPRETYVQMHLVVDRDDVAGAHAIADEVERRLADELGVKEALVHVEPEDDASGPPGSRGDSPVDRANVGKG